MEIIIGALIVAAAVIISFFLFSRVYSRRIEKDILGRLNETLPEMQSKSNEQAIQFAGEIFSKHVALSGKELESKKELIDGNINRIRDELEKVQNLMHSIEKDTSGKFSDISAGLKNQSEATTQLHDIVTSLNKVLTPSQSRGRWGERMAEDILRLAVMEEGVNYIKQRTLGAGRRPDFTFLLPQGKIVNMDVKFPFDNYRKYVEETNEPVREEYKKQFLKDARTSIKQVTTRDYINTDADTLDYVIVFIPMEQAYSFIMEHDRSFIDDALKQKVIVCSPWTLYAYVAVIRQSIDNFNIERSTGKIMALMNEFRKQWDNYKTLQDKIAERIDGLQREYNTLLSTRSNQLERPLQAIDELTSQRELLSNGSDKEEN